MNKTLIFFILLLTISPLFAEYRVYQYLVKNSNLSSRDSESYIVTSTLDPISYRAYRGGRENIALDLTKTWFCPGDTSNKEICSSPENKLQALLGDQK